MIHRQRTVPLMTRRQLLARAGLVGAAGITRPAIVGPRVSAARRVASGEGGELYFENWPGYIDPNEDDVVGTVDRFVEATDIDLTYTEAINDNEEYFALIQPVLGRGDTIDPDIMTLTGWMAGRLMTIGWLDELPLDDVPNAANLRDDLVDPPWDPEGRFTLPWQTGLTGIA
jgi:spermidine/putrescine transport system substrate-binding protein